VQCGPFEQTVHLDVAEQEILQIRVAFEWNACPLPHRTVGSVAPSEVACSNLFLLTTRMAQEATHTVGLWHPIHHLKAALDNHPD
jgi:hypothetical protein